MHRTHEKSHESLNPSSEKKVSAESVAESTGTPDARHSRPEVMRKSLQARHIRMQRLFASVPLTDKEIVMISEEETSSNDTKESVNIKRM